MVVIRPAAQEWALEFARFKALCRYYQASDGTLAVRQIGRRAQPRQIPSRSIDSRRDLRFVSLP